MSVRPEFGPTLPALARRRLGIPTWLTAALVLLVVAAAALAVLMRAGLADGRADLVFRGKPAFNLLYEERLVRPLPPGEGELARLVARPEPAAASITVAPLPDSDLPFGALPVFAERRVAALRAELPGMRLRAEGKARIWGHPGYRFEYRAGRLTGVDVLLFPDDTALRGGAVVSFRHRSGARSSRTRAAVGEVRRVMRSFQFGAERR